MARRDTWIPDSAFAGWRQMTWRDSKPLTMAFRRIAMASTAAHRVRYHPPASVEDRRTHHQVASRIRIALTCYPDAETFSLVALALKPSGP